MALHLFPYRHVLLGTAEREYGFSLSNAFEKISFFCNLSFHKRIKRVSFFFVPQIAVLLERITFQ